MSVANDPRCLVSWDGHRLTRFRLLSLRRLIAERRTKTVHKVSPKEALYATLLVVLCFCQFVCFFVVVCEHTTGSNNVVRSIRYDSPCQPPQARKAFPAVITYLIYFLLHRLLRRLRVEIDGQALAEVIAILDTEGTECFSLEGLFEVALSVVEQKKVKVFGSSAYRAIHPAQPFTEGTL